MDLKKFWKESPIAFILKNAIGTVIVFIAIAWVTLIIIDKYTRHGEAEILPALHGKYLEEAEVILKAQGLHAQVIDSMYDRNKPFGTIIEQTPPANSTVKRGRPVYLIINSKSIRQVPIPDVRDVSLRQAEAMLKSIEIQVKEIVYEPSEYKDLVLDIKRGGQSIQPGTRIPEGTALTLVVGSGQGTETIWVPNVLSLSLDEARYSILNTNMVLGAVHYDVPPTDATMHKYIVYRQWPLAGQERTSGSRIDLYLSTDKSKISEQNAPTEEEDFF